MKISKIRIKNLYGIEQLELDGKSIELTGTNGIGKSSVIDAIRLALTNDSKRKTIVRNGEKEGSIYIETDTGLKIDRKKRTDKSDYKSIKDENGNEINSPETFLKEIFTPLQLEPVEFLTMSEKEQNKLLLNLIEFNQDKREYITEKFGPIDWVDYSNSILEILNEIQDKDGLYYQNREEINRNIRNGNAIINDIVKDIPENYQAEKWRNYTLSDKYEELNKMKFFNEKIDKSIAYKEDYENKIKHLETIENNTLLQVEKDKAEEKNKIEKEIEEYKSKIALLQKDLENIDNKYFTVISETKSETIAEKAKLDENIKVANEWASKERKDTDTLEKELKTAEQMKGYLNEYDRAMEMREKVKSLEETSQALTDKIELARKLPGEILATAKIPVKNLTVENGIPLVNGLPINNLSEGQKLQLCVDVSLSDINNLKLILIDGTEKLSDENRKKLYEICKEHGLQIIATRTDNSDELIITELED